VVNEQKISEILREQTALALGKEKRVFVIHDPCDIRKPYAEKMEKLGKVRDLDGNLISGYSTFNTICVTEDGKELRLSDITVFSNGDEAYYVRQVDLNKLEKKVKQAEKAEKEAELTKREVEIQQLVEKEEYINLRRVTRQQLKAVSEGLKAKNEEMVINHILDRQFDGVGTFEFIDKELKDEFVIRLKVSRNGNEVEIDEKGKEKHVKLTKATLSQSKTEVIGKIVLKKRVYEQAKRIIDWGELTLNGRVYQLVRITFLTREGKSIFKQPMLLLTNFELNSHQNALGVYRAYLMRAKIEGVFKFIKNALGWEEFQVRDWESIKNLIATAFFIGGYFYEIEPELAHHPVIEWLCQLGGGKGHISRHYFLEGLKCLLIHQYVENFRQATKGTLENNFGLS